MIFIKRYFVYSFTYYYARTMNSVFQGLREHRGILSKYTKWLWNKINMNFTSTS